MRQKRKGCVPYWARPGLGVMGMRLEVAEGARRARQQLEELPTRLRAEVDARRGGNADAIAAAVEQVNWSLSGLPASGCSRHWFGFCWCVGFGGGAAACL